MALSASEYHLLGVEDTRGKRTIHLEAATYSIGRDKANAIMVESPGISRQHALLLRLPKPGGKGYQYRLVDGNAQGKPSANGIYLNEERIKTRNLQTGDVVLLANEVKLSYRIVTMAEAEFVKYLEEVDFQSIKSAPKTSTATVAGDEMEFDPTLVRKDERLEPAVTATPKPISDVEKSVSLSRYWLVGVGGILAGIIGGGLLLWGLGIFSAPEPNPTPSPASQQLSSFC